MLNRPKREGPRQPVWLSPQAVSLSVLLSPLILAEPLSVINGHRVSLPMRANIRMTRGSLPRPVSSNSSAISSPPTSSTARCAASKLSLKVEAGFASSSRSARLPSRRLRRRTTLHAESCRVCVQPPHAILFNSSHAARCTARTASAPARVPAAASCSYRRSPL